MEDSHQRKSHSILHVLLIIVLIALIIGLLLFALNTMLPGFVSVLEKGDQQEIENFLRSFGTAHGILLAFLLQFFQIVSIFFPGGPIQIAVGIVFGTLTGFLICHLSYVLANLLVFVLARKLGNRLNSISELSNAGSGKLRFISESKHPAFMVMLACLMPFLPNGLVPYIASRTKISFWSYLLAVWIGSAPCLLLLNAIGSKLAGGEYFFVIVLCAVFAVFVLLMLFNRNRIFLLAEQFRKRFFALIHHENDDAEV